MTDQDPFEAVNTLFLAADLADESEAMRLRDCIWDEHIDQALGPLDEVVVCDIAYEALADQEEPEP